MRTTIQRNVRAAAYSCLLLLSALSAAGQSTFQNLGFENTTHTGFLVNPLSGYYATNATVPGWNWIPHQTFGIGDPNTTVAFNNSALDSAAVTLHGLNSYLPAIRGTYSIYLQGGSRFVSSNSFASIFQTGQVPSDSRSLIYSGGSSLQVFFNGQMLTPVALSNSASYTIWGADISSYAGQSGELRFTAPWQSASLLDGIQFSPTPVPEPSVLMLAGLFIVCFLVFLKRRNHALQRL